MTYILRSKHVSTVLICFHRFYHYYHFFSCCRVDYSKGAWSFLIDVAFDDPHIESRIHSQVSPKLQCKLRNLLICILNPASIWVVLYVHLRNLTLLFDSQYKSIWNKILSYRLSSNVTADVNINVFFYNSYRSFSLKAFFFLSNASNTRSSSIQRHFTPFCFCSSQGRLYDQFWLLQWYSICLGAHLNLKC